MISPTTKTLCLVFLLSFVPSAYADFDMLRIQTVEMLESSSELPPAENEPWLQTQLPYKNSNPKFRTNPEAKYIWFKFNLQNDQPRSLYIPHYYFNLKIFLNGNEVGGSFAAGDKQAVGFAYPVLVRGEEHWKVAESNTVHIRLLVAVPTTLLSEIYTGQPSDVEEFWEARVTEQLVSSLSSLLICLLLAIFTFGLWLKRKQDYPYLIFALLAAAWCLPMLYMLLPFSPVDHSLWLRLAYLGFDFTFLCLFLFISRILSFNYLRLERLLIFKSLISLVLVFALSIYHIHYLLLIVYSVNIVALIFIFYRSCRTFISKAQPEAFWVMLSFFILISILGHDLYLFVESAIFGGLIKSMTYFQIGFPAVLLILFTNLIKRFVDALDEAEILNLELEARVRKSAEALELSYRENREIELLHAANQEKQRIYQDLHDDVGSKLVSIIHSKEKENSKQMAKSALASLRESVANSKSTTSNLHSLIDSIVDEAEIRCLSAGFGFEYHQDDFKEYELDGEINRHLSRIVREAITNIIKHAQAKKVGLAFERLEKGIAIYIKDDGIGINPLADFGSGIENMRQRAKIIGADIEWLALVQKEGISRLEKEKGCQVVVKYLWKI